jgi:hypothetical protein
MQSPYNGPPWTSQRTRALFRLFATSAPPDFRRQILERVAQRQHALGRQRRRWRSPRSRWRKWRAWGVGTAQSQRMWRRRGVATVGWCGLVLMASLAWWVAQTGPAAPPSPAVLVSRAVSPPSDTGGPPEALIRIDHLEWSEQAESQGAMVRAADLPEPIATAPPMPPGTGGSRPVASQAKEELERTLPGPLPVPRLTVQKERHPPAYKHTQRSERLRGAPGKATRPPKGQRQVSQVPG